MFRANHLKAQAGSPSVRCGDRKVRSRGKAFSWCTRSPPSNVRARGR